MRDNSNGDGASLPQTTRARVPLPAGYRQAIVTAITVILGFSLVFLRFWNFELSGPWRAASLAASALMALAIALELSALWRSLRLEDDDETEYRLTLRWFLSGTIMLALSLLCSAVAYNHVLGL
jgi:hypothetical protein